MSDRVPVGVVIGASNVTCCLGPVVAAAAEALGGAAELHIVAGRGRSFVTASRVLLRSLPSIAESTVWGAIGRTEVARALITDVGNDIMYGQSPETILRHVDEAAARCRDLGAELAIGRLPMARLRRVRPAAYEAVRLLFFGRERRFPLAEAIRRAETVDEGLAEIAARHDAVEVVPDGRWYGADPIHIRLRHAIGAWRTIMSSWRTGSDGDGARISGLSVWRHHIRLTCALPSSARVAGVRVGDPTRPARPIRVGARVTVTLH